MFVASNAIHISRNLLFYIFRPLQRKSLLTKFIIQPENLCYYFKNSVKCVPAGFSLRSKRSLFWSDYISIGCEEEEHPRSLVTMLFTGES